jgi:adenylosuccinate synthase
VGVVKAYTTRVGGGPFPTELTDSRGGGDRPDGAPGSDVGLHLQTVGGEVGVTTGRKRRCGWFDAEVVRFAHRLNGFTSLNLTKLDVLDDVDIIRLGVGYKLRGAPLPAQAFPGLLEDLSAVEVEYETIPGWQTSTRGVTTFAALPKRAQAYVRRLERLTGVPVAYIGTGPGRDEMITRGFSFD